MEAGRHMDGAATVAIRYCYRQVQQRSMPNGSNTLFVKVVGRHRSCDVVITDDTVSGRHCQITESPDGCIIEDLGSQMEPT